MSLNLEFLCSSWIFVQDASDAAIYVQSPQKKGGGVSVERLALVKTLEVQTSPSAVQAVAQAVGADDFARAASLADAALAKGFNHPIFFIARALLLERQARDEDALAAFQHA